MKTDKLFTKEMIISDDNHYSGYRGPIILRKLECPLLT